MADTTTNYGLPFPEGGDGVVVHTDIERLAKRVDYAVSTEIQSHAQQVQDTYGHLPDDVAEHERKLEPVERGSDQDFRIRDAAGRVALGVRSNGDAQIGATIFRENEPGVRYMDRTGRVAFEITEHGQTHIYDSSDAPPTSTVTTVHVFIAAGQSNMSGRGLPVEGPQSPRIMQFGANRRVIEQAPLRLDMIDSPSGTSPATFFAHHYLATQPGHVGVLLIPAARGGTMFRGTPDEPSTTWTWTKGAASDPEHALYERSVQQTLDAIDAAKAQGYHVILKGVLWHQGEGNGGMATEAYAARLDTLISDYRTDLDHPTLPFMVGQQSPEGFIANPSKLTVDAAHQDTPYRTPFTGFAPSTWDGHNEGDTTHFSTVGTSHLGDTYMTAYTQALGNTFSKE